jgi:hypothetical protein
LGERVSSTCPDGQKLLSFLSNGHLLVGLYYLLSIEKKPPLTVVIPAEQFRTPWTKIPTSTLSRYTTWLRTVLDLLILIHIPRR